MSLIISAIDIPNTYPMVSGKNCGRINLTNDESPWALSRDDIIIVSYIFDEKSSINVPTKRVKPPIMYSKMSSVRLLLSIVLKKTQKWKLGLDTTPDDASGDDGSINVYIIRRMKNME